MAADDLKWHRRLGRSVDGKRHVAGRCAGARSRCDRRGERDRLTDTRRVCRRDNRGGRTDQIDRLFRG